MRRLVASGVALAFVGGVLAPSAAAQADDTMDQLLESVGLSSAELPPELADDISNKVDELVDDGVIDEEKVDEVTELPEEEREELIRDRADQSRGLAHAVVRFLNEQGIETETGGVKDALAEFLAAYMEENGLTLPDDDEDAEGEDGPNLRKIFVMYLADVEDIDVTKGKLREALVDNGYGPTPEEIEERATEREARKAERDARREERKAEHREKIVERRSERRDKRGGDGNDEMDELEPPKLEGPDSSTDEERMPEGDSEDIPEPDTTVPSGESA